MRLSLIPGSIKKLRAFLIVFIYIVVETNAFANYNAGFSQHPFLSSHFLTSTTRTGCRKLIHEKNQRQNKATTIINIRDTTTQQNHFSRRLSHTAIKLYALPPVPEIVSSLFAPTNVPLWQAFAINAILFSSFSSKLLKSLTPEGFAHAMALGTLLWATLGYRGWLVCVAYLIFGSIVTKIRFKEKESAGIAEARGGRRGPENVWLVF